MSYVVKPTTNGNWKVQKTDYNNGKPRRTAVPKLAWTELGFNESMSLEEAKDVARRLNKETTLKKNDNQKLINAANRLKLEDVIDSVYTPQAIAVEFVEYLKLNYLSRQKSKTKMLSHWQKAQEILRKLKLLPKDFHTNKNAITSHLQSKEYSLDYAKKILRVINLWGQFYSEKHSQFYRGLPKLDTYDIESINDAYSESDGFVGASESITPNDLVILKDKLPAPQYLWLCFSVWFGLRPAEINRLHHLKNPATVEKAGKIPVLVVYQEKLVRVSREKRYKRIPAFLPEQKEVLKNIKQPLKQPLVKTLRRHIDKKIGLYGGRKGFTDLMLSKNQKLENISSWMGHTSIDITWRVYKDKNRVSYDEVG